ncbi:SEC-C metal-binding domain-containing protein [Listeria monocytogenes]
MIDYFLSKKNINEIQKVIISLNTLKKRITNQDYSNAFKEYKESQSLFKYIKQYAIQNKDEELANAQYIFKCYFLFFANLSSFFLLLQEKKYTKSWIKLQDCIDNSVFFLRFEAKQNYDLNNLSKTLYEYEKLYPYTYFFSSEFIYKRAECSICGKSILDLNCPHIVGELYWGDCAVQIISEIEKFQAIALVENPKDKRCILSISNDRRTEEEKFIALENIFLNFKNHLQTFNIKKTYIKKRDTRVPEIGKNQICFCGSSKKFKKCCMKKMYYNHCHFEITVSKAIQINYF